VLSDTDASESLDGLGIEDATIGRCSVLLDILMGSYDFGCPRYVDCWCRCAGGVWLKAVCCGYGLVSCDIAGKGGR